MKETEETKETEATGGTGATGEHCTEQGAGGGSAAWEPGGAAGEHSAEKGAETARRARSIPDTMSNADASFLIALLARRLANNGLITLGELEALKMAAHRTLGRYLKKARDEWRRGALRNAAPAGDGTGEEA